MFDSFLGFIQNFWSERSKCGGLATEVDTTPESNLIYDFFKCEKVIKTIKQNQNYFKPKVFIIFTKEKKKMN
jgi:hypothetical protein